jgi:hypothetical protein
MREHKAALSGTKKENVRRAWGVDYSMLLKYRYSSITLIYREIKLLIA